MHYQKDYEHFHFISIHICISFPKPALTFRFHTFFVVVAAPNFVSSFTQGDFVYFFFRETAVEYINCGKVSAFSKRLDRMTEQ